MSLSERSQGEAISKEIDGRGTIAREAMAGSAAGSSSLGAVSTGRFSRLLMATLLVLALFVAGSVLGSANIEILLDALQFTVFAVATNILIGYGGLISFGQAVFYGAGAYTIALTWYHFRLDFWYGFIAAPFVGAGIALVVGIIVLRTRGLYFALLTLAFAELLYTIALQQIGFTNGSTGIFGTMVPSWMGNPRYAFYFSLGITVLALAILWVVVHSPFGLTLRAIRENRERAESLGVNVFRHQLLAYVIAGFFCALAGTLFVVYDSAAYPSLLDWITSGIPVFMVVIGGMSLFYGPALGALVYTVAYTLISRVTSQWELIFGIVLILVAILAPQGLAGLMLGEQGRNSWLFIARRWIHDSAATRRMRQQLSARGKRSL